MCVLHIKISLRMMSCRLVYNYISEELFSSFFRLRDVQEVDLCPEDTSSFETSVEAFPLQAWTGHWGSRRLRLQTIGT